MTSTPRLASRAPRHLAWLGLASIALATPFGCGAGSAADGELPAGGKADTTTYATTAAPGWMLRVEGKGSWTESATDAPQEHVAGQRVVHAWVDARLADRRYHKRVFVETASPYSASPSAAGAVVLRTLHPAKYKRSAGGGAEEIWGTDTIEIYPDGGPHGATLSGPVLFRLRMQEDIDGDGIDEIVATAWQKLYGEGPLWTVADVWGGGLSSPVRGAAAPAPTEVYFTPFDDAGMVVVREIERVIAAERAMPAKRNTIHAAIFNINDHRITDKLIEAHRSGVEVRLITDAKKLRPAATWQTEDDRLLKAGVPLLGLRLEGRGAMHDKFALFNGRRLTTGSFNWELGSSKENHENMLLTAEPQLLAAYAKRFERLAGQAASARRFAHDPSATASVSFAPDEQPARIMGELIDQARSTLHIAMFTCKDVSYRDGQGQQTSLFARLKAAVGRGVEVTVITDHGIAEASEYYGQLSPDDPMDELLESYGVHVVRADNTFGRYASMHHKFTVIDEQILVTGALNWYYDAAYLNEEDQLVLRDPQLAKNYLGEFTDLLARYDEDYRATDWAPVAVTFEVDYAHTGWGDKVVLVGDTPELGAWDPKKGLVLSGASWPRWRGTVSLPAGLRVAYKVVVLRKGGGVDWQSGGNRRLRVPTDVTKTTVKGSFE
jgi:phosphatidylserine/phosphatidylglycerophosphate/cardiolipin synthase-like enzyme